MITIAQCQQIHAKIIAEDWVGAGNQVFELLGNPATCKNKAVALDVLRKLFQHLLDSENYLEAASLQWGGDVFQTEPESTVRVFRALREGSMVLLLGASSMSKTYAAGAFYLLDYLRDPLYTTVKLAAVNEDHLRKNLFAHVATLYRSCAIPSQYDIQIRDSDLWMGVKDAGYEFGISGIAFKQSQETSGQFKGYKAKPVRKTPHPKFGVMSRLRVLGDEGQNWPNGPFKDFNSLVASKTGAEMIKIAVAFNPESMSQHVVQLAEPDQGWLPEELDSLYDYESKAGWRVCRLDAALSENVKQRKVVFAGLQTYEGFMSYLKSGGDTSPNYFCFARGFPPLKGSVNTIIPPTWPQEARGEVTFVETPVTLAACDLAFMGKDSAQMAVGRWGLASGYRDNFGKFVEFKNRLNAGQNQPRHVLQIDQILPLHKHEDTVRMSEEIIGRCKMLEIKPEWVAVDQTGYGFGVWSHLYKYWGSVYGISWNTKATSGKILAEDQETAEFQCEGIMSEMWWCFRRWLDPRVKAIMINPIIPASLIQTQLTSRRYSAGKSGKIKVESKEIYRTRNGGMSCDEADACIMLSALIRKNDGVLPGTVESQLPAKRDDPAAVVFQPMMKADYIHDEDSLGNDGSKKEEEMAMDNED